MKSEELREVRENMDEVYEALDNAIQACRTLERSARKMGGEVSRVVGGQIDLYTSRTLKSFLENEHQPGSIASLSEFLKRYEEEMSLDGGEEEQRNERLEREQGDEAEDRLPRLSSEKVFDVDSADVWAPEIQKGINAPLVGIQKSTLGGAERVSLLILVSLDEKKDWPNGILENSTYFRMHLGNDGVLDQFHGYVKGIKFRKTRVKSYQEVIDKVNKYIEVVKANMNKVAKELLGMAKEVLGGEHKAEDYQELLSGMKHGYPILTSSEIHKDIPTIHNFDRKYHNSVKHIGFGSFVGKTEHGEFSFDGGGAMEHAGSISWTNLRADDQVLKDLGYDVDKVEKALNELIKEASVTASSRTASLKKYGNTDAQEWTLGFVESLCRKAGVFIQYGTSVGKSPQSVVLDITHQGGEVSVSSNGSLVIGVEDEYPKGMGDYWKVDEERVKQYLVSHKKEIYDSLIAASGKNVTAGMSYEAGDLNQKQEDEISVLRGKIHSNADDYEVEEDKKQKGHVVKFMKGERVISRFIVTYDGKSKKL